VVDQVQCRLLPHAEGLPLPSRATPGAAGLDLRAALTEPITLSPGERRLVPTGLVLAIPEGWEGQVRPRSGLAIKHGITLINSPGTIDSDYRGELLVPLVNLGQEPFVVARGDRIAQIVFAAVAPVGLVAVDTLPAPRGERGTGGFGSTGRQ
jgi:dUTP pyrophosphatase